MGWLAFAASAFLALLAISSVASQEALRGPEGSVCSSVKSRQVSVLVETRRKRQSGVWDAIEGALGMSTPRPGTLEVRYVKQYYVDYECCTGWNRINDTCQDADECFYLIDDCDPAISDCENTVGSYNCRCHDGYFSVNRTYCTDVVHVDECATDNGGCEQNCVDSLTSYHCTCNDGYNLAADGHACDNIDECSVDMGGCDHACRDTVGSYECSCRPRHRLVSGTECREDDMYPYGDEIGEKHKVWDHKQCLKVPLPVEGFRFFTERYFDIWICDNGLVSFRSIARPSSPVRLSDSQWLKWAVLVPYLARSDPDLFNSLPEKDRTKVYYSIHRQGDGHSHTENILNRANQDGRSTPRYFLPEYQAVWAMVVTWANLPPSLAAFRGERPVPLKLIRRNTFQLVISTDGCQSFATFIYPALKQEWYTEAEARIARTDRRGKIKSSEIINPAVAGYSAGNGNKDHREEIGHGSKMKTVFRMPSTYAGNFKYALQEAGDVCPSPAVAECSAWLRLNPVIPETLPGYDLVPTPGSCPCTAEQAYFDRSYTFSVKNSRSCATSRIKVRSYVGSQVYRMWRTCCYQPSYWYHYIAYYSYLRPGWRHAQAWRIGGGALISGQLGGNLVVGNAALDEVGRKSCCEGSSSYHCNLFRERRPLSVPTCAASCRQYDVTSALSWSRYDPHIRTLDGKEYTFNGLGEYVLLDANGEYMIQGRTAYAPGSSHATSFSAIVAYQRGHPPVQINLVDENRMELYMNGTLVGTFPFGDDPVEEPYEFEDDDSVAVYPNMDPERSLLIFFNNALSVKVTAAQSMLHFEFSVPNQFKSATRGLLGYFDGNADNDFVAFDGTQLPADATERQIYEDFGETWRVTEVDGPKKTMFTYRPGESIDSFTNDSYVPQFSAEMNFSADPLYETATEICGSRTDCLFDTIQTRDTSVGEAAIQTQQNFDQEVFSREQFPPTLDGPDRVVATVGDLLEFSVSATDRSGDRVARTAETNQMAFELGEGVPPDANFVTDGDTATFSWNVSSAEPFDLQIDVTNENNASAQLWPTVYLCACQHGGFCDQDTEDEGNFTTQSNGTRKFKELPCTCAVGYTGKNCESELDACAENFNPCFAGVTCEDLPPPAGIDGYVCGECPAGFEGDGQNCTDIDECLTDEGSLCDHFCVNILGNFSCGCNDGFYLDEDQATCKDVDECVFSNNCSQLCINTHGSYRCDCWDGFTLSADEQDCEAANPCTSSDDPGCAPETSWCVVNGSGAAVCVCFRGFQLAGDDVTCEDADECLGDNHCNQLCNNTLGGYECYCEEGYELTDSLIEPCEDIDECFEGTYNCSADEECSNLPGEYMCVCSDGTERLGNQCVEVFSSTIPGNAVTEEEADASTASMTSSHTMETMPSSTQRPPPPPTTMIRSSPTTSTESPQEPVTTSTIPSTSYPGSQPTGAGTLEENTLVLKLAMSKNELTESRLRSFKRVVAAEMTTFCDRNVEEIPSCRARHRRDSRVAAAVFTASSVHIPPGFPRQVGGYVFLGFFVAVDSSFTAVPLSVTHRVMGASRRTIGESLASKHVIADIISYEEYSNMEEPTTETETEEKFPLVQVVAGSVAGAVALVAVAITTVVCCKKNSGRRSAPANIYGVTMPAPSTYRSSSDGISPKAWGVDSPFTVNDDGV
ncbi:MUC4 [Branchiostoma lanceolatum]|uniref:MUC4 protein n=1 Tax=Branchiostoma lanceolatum TaxID=7740 RepID=A0A8J9ZWA2_BRALA|nr:MUC4 [Branchiostoma lanceolatum]